MNDKKGPTMGAFLPVLGLVLAVALAAIAYVASGPVHQFLMDQPQLGIPAGTTVQLLIAGLLWLLLLLFAGLLYSMFAPKPEKLATEAQMKKEKVQTQKEKLARKKRQQTINRQMARDREAKSQGGSNPKKR